MQKITPFLWFDDQAEEAMNFYVSIFKNSRVLPVTRAQRIMAAMMKMKKIDIAALQRAHGEP